MPAKKPTLSVPDSIKAEVAAKAAELIEKVLQRKHVKPPPKDQQFNFIIDIGSKWHRNYFYFFSTYACPSPNTLSPTFQAKFARMEYRGDAKYALEFCRHTGKWVMIYGDLSVDESMKAIQNDAWFEP